MSKEVKVEIWAIDAWASDDEGWAWNDRMRIGSFRADEDDITDVFFADVLPHYFFGEPSELDIDWYCEDEAEISMSETCEPVFQLVIVGE